MANAAGVEAVNQAASVRRRRTVLLLIETSRAHGRACLRGVARYVRTNPGWSCVTFERSSEEPVPDWVFGMRIDGALVRMETPQLAADLDRLNVPFVDLRARPVLAQRSAPKFTTDSDSIADVAFRHFVERGFRHFGFCGYAGVDFSDDRENHLRPRVESSGRSFSVYREDAGDEPERVVHREGEGGLSVPQIANWLISLPKPLGVVCCNDVRARDVLEACESAGLRVPEQVAVLGVDNDELICEFTFPPLSSVDPNAELLGYRAAETLDRLMDGAVVPSGVIHVPAAGVVTRLSTDVMAIEDPIVAEAVAVIRDHACTGMNVDRLLDRLTVSRATLERRFNKSLGRSPRSEIARVRMDRARQLLAETELPLSEIAIRCGMRSASHLSVAFRAAMNMTPGEYRRQHQKTT